jgi:hypothetical protein
VGFLRTPGGATASLPPRSFEALQIATIAPRSNSLHHPHRCQIRKQSVKSKNPSAKTKCKNQVPPPFQISKSNGKDFLPFDLKMHFA